MLVVCACYAGLMCLLCWWYAPAMLVVCACYASTMRLLCVYYAPAMRLLCGWYAAAMRPLCVRYASAMRLLCACYAGVCRGWCMPGGRPPLGPGPPRAAAARLASPGSLNGSHHPEHVRRPRAPASTPRLEGHPLLVHAAVTVSRLRVVIPQPPLLPRGPRRRRRRSTP